MGYLIHRFGSRHVIMASGLGSCLLVPILVTHHSLIALGVNLALLGACYGCLDVAMNAHSVQVQAIHQKPIISGIHGWFSLAGIVGGLGAAAASNISPLTHLLIVSAAMIAALLACFGLLLPSSADQDSEGPKLIFPKGILLVLGLLSVCAFVSEGGILDWCALYIRGPLHAKPEFGGVATAACCASMAAGRFVGDPLLHRFGNRKVVVSSGIISFAGLICAVAVPSVPICIACLSLAGFGIANMVPVFFKEAARVPGVAPGPAMAAVTTCGYAGFLLGPPIIGTVADKVSLGFSIGSLGLLGLIVSAGSYLILDSRH
jgi:MFS family permease